jgi:hypothetical protein
MASGCAAIKREIVLQDGPGVLAVDLRKANRNAAEVGDPAGLPRKELAGLPREELAGLPRDGQVKDAVCNKWIQRDWQPGCWKPSTRMVTRSSMRRS